MSSSPFNLKTYLSEQVITIWLSIRLFQVLKQLELYFWAWVARNRLFLNFYANFYAYLIANFGNITTVVASFCHTLTAHAQKRLCVHFLSKFWHHQWILWSRFPRRKGYFCDGSRLPFTLNSSHPISVCIQVLDKARFPLPKVTALVNGASWRVTGFHYPSSRAVLTGACFH